MNNVADLSGKWTYRSFHNIPEKVTDSAEHALKLFFAEATFTFDLVDTKLTGSIDWEGGGLDLSGVARNGCVAGGVSSRTVQGEVQIVAQ